MCLSGHRLFPLFFFLFIFVFFGGWGVLTRIDYHITTYFYASLLLEFDVLEPGHGAQFIFRRLLQLGTLLCWLQFRDMCHLWCAFSHHDFFPPPCLIAVWILTSVRHFLYLQIPSTYGPERLDLLRQLEKVKEMEDEVNPNENADEEPK